MKLTLIVRPLDMLNRNFSGSDVIEDVLKRTTGEEWAVSGYTMVAGATTMVDTPDNVSAWIRRYDGDGINRKMEHRLLISVPDEAIKLPASFQSVPEITQEDGKRWKLVWDFIFK